MYSSGLDALAKVSEVQFEVLRMLFADEGGDGEGGCFFVRWSLWIAKARGCAERKRIGTRRR